jgi:hypothetical protein
MTELFFEGEEPALDEFPLEDLLALFPEGYYRFIGTTVDGVRQESVSMLTHAVPDGPQVSSEVDDDKKPDDHGGFLQQNERGLTTQ